ncbi:MAG TPA: PAS domain S-box protein, partial [Prolixibacteraceae bacterium]|nr:PAS domain S-box protein [Prolixibacteraceae bacterium]
NALWFILQYHKEVFGEVPVSFCGINNYKKSLIKEKQHYTGLVEVLDVKPTIDLALNLHPETQKIVVIVDSTPTGLGQKKDIAAVAQHYGNVKFEYIEGKDTSHSELLEKLRSLSQDTIVLLSVWLRDKNNVYLSPNEGGRLMSANAPVPIYGIIDMYYGYGIVGGKLLNSRTHGRIAAETAFRIINGEKPANIPVIFKSTNPYMFDYKQLERWKINSADLPQDSIIINKPVSLYKAYKRLIWIVIGAFTFLIFIVLLLSMKILSRKKIEKTLRESAERHRNIIQTAMDGFWLVDQEGRLLEVNKAYCRMSGYNEKELLKLSISELEASETPEEIAVNIQKFAAQGNTRIERKHRRKNGNVFDIEISIQYQPEMGGRFFCFLRDITKLKIAKKALQNSEKKWRNVLEKTPQIGLSLNKNGEITFVNAHFLLLTGWKKDDVIGQNWFDMFIPENVREEVKNVFFTVMAQKDTIGLSNYENEIIGKSGDVFNIAWSNVLTKDTAGYVVDVTCLGLDLTERKRAENKLKKSETKYRTIMEAAQDPVYVCSEDHKIQYMNPAMIDRIGHDATGQLCYEALHGFDKKCKWCKYEETFQNGYTEKNIISPLDNRSFHVSSTVFVNENESLSKLSVFRDTTEFIKLQKRLQQAQKMEAIGNLAGGIAHDFNNILFPIIGMSEMMMEDLPAGGLELEYANEINKAGHRAKELVSQILSFSRQSDQEKMPVRVFNC